MPPITRTISPRLGRAASSRRPASRAPPAPGARVAAAQGDPAGGARDRRRDQQPGQVAGEEQRRHRGAPRGQRVDDQDVARRNQQAGGRAGQVDRGGVLALVALARHLRRQESADRRGCRHRRAADRAEQRARHHVDPGQAAGQEPGERLAEVDQPARYAAAVHDLAGEHEQRDGEQREAVEAGRRLLRQGGERRAGVDRHQQPGRRRQPERERHRHPQRQQQRERGGEDQRGAGAHRLSSSTHSSASHRQ
jgi:hypothetical protein